MLETHQIQRILEYTAEAAMVLRRCQNQTVGFLNRIPQFFHVRVLKIIILSVAER